MDLIVKKYIRYDMQPNNLRRKYEQSYFKGDGSTGIWYMIVVFDLMECFADIVIADCAQRSNRGYRDDSVSIDLVYDKGVKIVEITSLDFIDLDTEYQPDYVLRRQDFAAVVKKYRYCLDNNVSHFYLILLQGNRVVLEEDLNRTDLIMPKKWLEYVKVAYVEEDSWYTDVELTSSSLSWLSDFYFHLNSHEKIFKQFEDFKREGKVPSHISIDDVKRLIREWETLKSKDAPVYFIKQDDGSIVVRKSILDLRYIKMALQESGEYKIVDERGIGVFDFLEEFALGFSPEQFQDKINGNAALENVISYKSGNIDISYSEKENYALLNLGKAPREYEHIERDRARYKENRSVKMKLDCFKGIVSYWFSLQEKNAPEIYFTQKEDGSIVIRETMG